MTELNTLVCGMHKLHLYEICGWDSGYGQCAHFTHGYIMRRPNNYAVILSLSVGDLGNGVMCVLKTMKDGAIFKNY